MQTFNGADIQKHEYTDKHIHRQTDRQTDRGIDKTDQTDLTNTHTHTHTHTDE